MLDYLALQGSSENPTFITMLVTVLLSFLLSSIIAFTYRKTSNSLANSADFIQALVLLSIVAATVMQAIGDSLARGLGMLGALAIIRFRTNVKSTRNMAFTFAALAAGIACGVYGFVIGITGTLGFCATAFILHFNKLNSDSPLIGNLKLELPIELEEWGEVEIILDRFCKKYARVRYQIAPTKLKEKDLKRSDDILLLEYQLKLRKGIQGKALHLALSQLEIIRALKIDFLDQPEIV